jgi:hypothetical protein
MGGVGKANAFAFANTFLKNNYYREQNARSLAYRQAGFGLP